MQWCAQVPRLVLETCFPLVNWLKSKVNWHCTNEAILFPVSEVMCSELACVSLYRTILPCRYILKVNWVGWNGEQLWSYKDKIKARITGILSAPIESWRDCSVSRFRVAPLLHQKGWLLHFEGIWSSGQCESQCTCFYICPSLFQRNVAWFPF